MRTSVLALFAFLLMAAAASLPAQTLQIKLVNGRSGKAMGNKCIQVWVGDRSKPGSQSFIQTQTDANGSTTIRLTKDETDIQTVPQPLACGLSGQINPVVKFGNTISVRAGYVLCEFKKPGFSWLATLDFATQRVLDQGAVTPNHCGKAKVSPRPGEAVIFVRPLSWWEKMKQ